MEKKLNFLISSTILLVVVIFLAGSCKKYDNNPPAVTVADIDGNIYHSISIGTQVWMVENLKVTHYRNGDPVPNITDSITWINLETGACSDYNNDPGNSLIYGKLYNWYAVHDNNNLAPMGWHIPTVTEWQTLATYLGGNAIAGGKMKEANTSHWMSPNNGSTNESGFTVLPAGMRHEANGAFMSMGATTMLWSSSQDDLGSANNLYLGFSFREATNAYIDLNTGLSVRCIKDQDILHN